MFLIFVIEIPQKHFWGNYSHRLSKIAYAKNTLYLYKRVYLNVVLKDTSCWRVQSKYLQTEKQKKTNLDNCSKGKTLASLAWSKTHLLEQALLRITQMSDIFSTFSRHFSQTSQRQHTSTPSWLDICNNDPMTSRQLVFVRQTYFLFLSQDL